MPEPQIRHCNKSECPDSYTFPNYQGALPLCTAPWADDIIPHAIEQGSVCKYRRLLNNAPNIPAQADIPPGHAIQVGKHGEQFLVELAQSSPSGTESPIAEISSHLGVELDDARLCR